MIHDNDLTRWNRAGLCRFRYIDGNAAEYLETLRFLLANQFPDWTQIQSIGSATGDGSPDAALDPESRESDRLSRVLAQYHDDRRDLAWEICRTFSRACHVLTEHMDAYANESYLGTATQWDNVRKLVEMLDGRYSEKPVAAGLEAGGRLFEVFATPDGSTWTMVLTTPQGSSCVVAVGEEWQEPRQLAFDPEM